jgi:hypothetical protein
MSVSNEFSQIVLDLHRVGDSLRPTLDSLLGFYSNSEYKGVKNFSQIVLDLYRAGSPLRPTLKTLLWFYSSELNRALDAGGNTFLHYAYCYRDGDMIQFLLNHGANISIKNYAGKIATEPL